MNPLILKFTEKDQFNEIDKTFEWRDNRINNWEKFYDKMSIGDRGFFVGQGNVLSGILKSVNKMNSLFYDTIDEFDLSTDDLLRIEAFQPEINSRIKANFRPFISSVNIDYSSFKEDALRHNLIDFWIMKESAIETSSDKLKNGDRVVFINNQLVFESLKIVQNNILTDSKNDNSLFNVRDKSISEVISLLEKSSVKKFMKSNTANQLKRIEQELKQIGNYKFRSFNEYYNIIHNKKTFLNSSSPSIRYYVGGSYWSSATPHDQTENFMKEGIWKNNWDDKFQDIVNSIPIGSLFALKSTHKQVDKMEIKCIGEVLENYHDGKTLEVDWNLEFNPFMVGYAGGYWDTIKEVTNPDHIDDIFNHEEDDESANVRSRLALNTILFGPPGTGKTYETKHIAVTIIKSNEEDTKS